MTTMITLNKIRELLLNQEKELENMIIQYFQQNKNHFYTEKNSDLKLYKENTLSKIYELINKNDLEKARTLLTEYKHKIGYDVSFYSINGIINLIEGTFDKAYNNFFKGLEIDSQNLDLLYNMIYTNALLKNEENLLYYKNKFLQLTNDTNLINELDELITNLQTSKSYTIITIGVEADDIVLNAFINETHTIINIREKDDLEYENTYYNEHGIIIYEVPNTKYNKTIENIVKGNKNCVILCSDFSKIDLLKSIKENITLVYYPKRNYCKDNKYSVNKNYYLFNEKTICDLSDIIITDKINIYNYKKIIEERNNIYLITEEIDSIFNLKYILDNYNKLDNDEINSKIKAYAKNTEQEYDRLMYVIASEINNLNNILEISKYIYEKYKTEESYSLYLYLLIKIKDFSTLIYVASNSEYCDDIYKSEMIYLYAINNYDLIEFIVNLSIDNYKVFDIKSENNHEYKIALCALKANMFELSYSKYMEILYKEKDIMYSPLVNRNIGYLMYISGNDNYKKFYDIYKDLLEESLS